MNWDLFFRGTGVAACLLIAVFILWLLIELAGALFRAVRAICIYRTILRRQHQYVPYISPINWIVAVFSLAFDGCDLRTAGIIVSFHTGKLRKVPYPF